MIAWRTATQPNIELRSAAARAASALLLVVCDVTDDIKGDDSGGDNGDSNVFCIGGGNGASYGEEFVLCCSTLRERIESTILQMTGRPPKRFRSDTEISTLANELAADWVAGDAVQTWLRRHVAALTRKVHDDGWSWSDVGRALTSAGIVYRSGRPWSGHLLRRKADRVRPRDSNAKSGSAISHVTANMPGAAAPGLVPAAGAPAPSPDTACVEPETDEPFRLEFKPARLRGYSTPPLQPGPHSAAVSEGDPAAKQRALDVIDEFMGRTSARDFSEPDPDEPE
jgi:hypothetical protein